MHGPVSSGSTAGDATTKTQEQHRPSLDHLWNLDFTKRRLGETGEGLKQWDGHGFWDVINQHVDATWGTFFGKTKLLFAALTAVGSAALNMWFLLDKLTELSRNPNEDYNLTTWVLTFVELLLVYAVALFFFLLLTLSILSPQQSGNYIGTIRLLKMVGGFSALWGLKGLTISGLKKTRKSVSMFFSNVLCASDATLKFRCFAFLTFPLAVLWWLLPVFAPAALLLKLRQVDFVSTVYFTDWNYTKYFQFLGFMNNVIGLTANEVDVIKSAERMVFMNPDLAKEKDENWTDLAEMEDGDRVRVHKSFDNLIGYFLYEKVTSIFATLIILNTWLYDPDLYMALLRRASPIKK